MSAAAAVGDRVLALRVIEQAIHDATAQPIVAKRARTQCRPDAREQAEARRFLFVPACVGDGGQSTATDYGVNQAFKSLSTRSINFP